MNVAELKKSISAIEDWREVRIARVGSSITHAISCALQSDRNSEMNPGAMILIIDLPNDRTLEEINEIVNKL